MMVVPARSPWKLPLAALGLAGSVLLGCGDDGSGPSGPVEATLTLEGAVADDAALLLEIGPGAIAVERARGDLEVHSIPVRGGHSVAVFGPLADGPILILDLVEGNRTPTVTVRDVAASDGSLRTSLTGYEVRMKVGRR